MKLEAEFDILVAKDEATKESAFNVFGVLAFINPLT